MSKSSTTSETPLPLPIPASEDLGPLVGRTFGGYEITSYIGEGATGAVYRAEDLVGSRMAVKVMHRELSQKDAAEKLWADLQKLNALELPQMLKTYDAGFDDEGQFYYAMDELVGCDLEAGLEESGALAPQKALEIIRQVCAALDAAHAAGVVHGGLKPRNVFLAPRADGLNVKVLDFGAARLAGGVDKGVIVGNPFYMAPEQFGGVADTHTDIYSLGVMMYELFSGTLPFSGPNHGHVMMRHLAEVPQPPPGVDEELGRIILRALVKAPAGRYGSVKQLMLALDRWMQSLPAMLTDAAAYQVITRAAEARAMKQAALSAPDATTPMPKMDLAELARGTRTEVRNDRTPPLPSVQVSGGKDKGAGKNGSSENPNSSESVEASLEDFISQANASFPAAATSDGWDLHTGDVELLDEAEEHLESQEHVSAPLVVKPRAVEAKPAAKVEKKKTTRSMPVVQQEPLPEPLPPLPVEPESYDPSPSAPRRRMERTDVVSAPISMHSSTASVPWTANPLVIIGGLLAAFIIGAGLVFLMVRTMMPAQPMVMQNPVMAPPQAVAPQPVAAQPVVTPLPAQPVAAQPVAAQPVVTPLPAQQPAAVAPVAAPAPAPAPQPAAVAPAPAPEPAVAKKHVVAQPRPHKAAAPVEREPAPRAEKQPAPRVEKPAPKPAKKESKGSDWVDPFAQ